MFRKPKRHFSDGDFLYGAFIEFVKCWGSGGRSRLFMESKKGGAFVNFSTFLGQGATRSKQFKMASPPGEETSAQGYPDGRQDSTTNRDSKEKKVKKKSKRN